MIEEAKPAKPVDQVEEEYAALVAYELGSKKWDELEALEANGELLFPDVLHRRKRDGSFEAIQVAFKVPRQQVLRKARVLAKEIALREGIDQKTDKDQFDDLETDCILWHAVRSPTAPYEHFEVDVEALEKRLDRDVLKLAWAKLEGYRRVVDPRPAAITREQALAMIALIAKRRDISPLHAFDGIAQSAFIVFMASLLTSFMTPQSLRPSSGTLTPAL